MHMSPWHSVSSSQRLQEKMCKLDLTFDMWLFMGLQLSFSILLSSLEDWQKQKLHIWCSCLGNLKTEGTALCGLVADLSPPGYNLHQEKKKMEIGEVRLASNLWALSRVSTITACAVPRCRVAFWQDSHATCSKVTQLLQSDQYRTKLCMNTRSVCNNQSYHISKSLHETWNGKWSTSGNIFSCHKISTLLTR